METRVISECNEEIGNWVDISDVVAIVEKWLLLEVNFLTCSLVDKAKVADVDVEAEVFQEIKPKRRVLHISKFK